MSVVCPFSKILTGQRDGTGFPGNDKNLSRDRRSGKNGKLQSLKEKKAEVCYFLACFTEGIASQYLEAQESFVKVLRSINNVAQQPPQTTHREPPL